MTSKKDIEGELSLCRAMFVVSLRDMISPRDNYYVNKCRDEANYWLETLEEKTFSFSNVMDYLYDDDVEIDAIRKRIKKIFKNKKVKGTRNLMKILNDMNK